jgi:hypothetical protein
MPIPILSKKHCQRPLNSFGKKKKKKKKKSNAIPVTGLGGL